MDEECLRQERRHAVRVSEVIPFWLVWAQTRADDNKSNIMDFQREIFSIMAANLDDGDIVDIASLRAQMLTADLSLSMNNRLAQGLMKMAGSPWFGRVDFIEDGYGETEAIRVGRASLIDPETRDLLIYDWRAPICSLYYDAEVGSVSYRAPGGEVRGRMPGKWMISFENGVPVSAVASSLALEDELLIDLLSRSADPRMGDIVASIQREQNRIIRDERYDVLAVEGPAGSGKTSVALHRIAWLLYQHREHLDASRVRILSPNRLFSSYIAQVLPGLGERAAPTQTFSEIAQAALALNVEAHSRRLDRMIASPDGPEAGAWRVKAGRDMLARVRRYLEEYAPEFHDIALQKQVVIRGEEMALLYREYHVLPPALRLWRIRMLLHRRLEHRRRRIERALMQRYHDPQDSRQHIAAAVRLTALEAVEPAFAVLHRQTTLDPFILYERATGLPADAARRTVRSDDAALMLLICLHMGLAKPEGDVRHLIVDEAQDLTPAHLRSLRALFPNTSVTLLGDRRQTLSPGDPPDGAAWLEDMPGRSTGFMAMHRAYRSTRPIAEFCMRLCPASMPVDPVARDGTPPSVTTDAPTDALIGEMRADGCVTIAVITPTVAAAREAFASIGEVGAVLVDDEDLAVGGPVQVLPVSLAKGLEYDGVIVLWDEPALSDDSRRRLYTACSRALHRLALVTTPELKAVLG